MIIQKVTLDFSDSQKLEKLPLAGAGIEIDIKYPNTLYLVIIKIKNISDKYLTCHFSPKSDITESIDLDPKDKKKNSSLELSFNRKYPVTITIKETKKSRTWFPE